MISASGATILVVAILTVKSVSHLSYSIGKGLHALLYVSKFLGNYASIGVKLPL